LPSNGLPSSEPLAKVQNTNRIDMQEATNLAEEAIAFLNREHPSESKSNRSVNSVSILRFSNLKSSMMKSGEYNEALDISALAYVFNFEDSSGFVIISNDKRIENPLLAFTQKGSLVNGETDNPGLKLFLERLEGYMLESIAKYGKDDERRAMDVAKGGIFSGSVLDTVVRPLVPVEWDQKEPFNNNLEYKGCTSTSSGNVLAGCVATAVAQIMSYWEYPSSIGSTTYNWTFLNKYRDSSAFYPSPTDNVVQIAKKTFARKDVANLFQQIGTGVKMDYSDGCNGSGAADKNAFAFLASNGFRLSDLSDYFVIYAKPFLEAHRPLYASGCSPPAMFYSEKRCHAWVIDGLARSTTHKNYYIHNNWGWDGKDNGYYASGVFDPSQRDYQNVEFRAVYR